MKIVSNTPMWSYNGDVKMSNIEIPTFKFALREDIKNDKRFLPERAEPTATGWDVRAAFKNGVQSIVVKPGEWVMIPLGFRTFAPGGWWMDLRPRSSTTAKKKIHALYGVLDEAWEGETCFCGQYLPDNILSFQADVYEKNLYGYGGGYEKTLEANVRTSAEELIIYHGDKIGQLIPVKRQEMSIEEISNEDFNKLCAIRGGVRGAQGFGSTGR